EHTCIVLASDHGEEFQEHGRLFHHHARLYDELIRVPLIMHCPGRLPGGVVVDSPVTLTDVMPTVLELIGLPVPVDLDGRSLLPAIADEAAWPQRPAISECDGSAAESTGLTRAIHTGTTKLITSTIPDTPPTQLFNLRNDPRERH